MKKNVLLLIITFCSFMNVVGQGVWRNINDTQEMKTIPIRKVRVYYNQEYDANPLNKLGSLTAVEEYVWFSDKPGGEKSGYYGIQTIRNFIVNGSKKDKTKYSEMISLGGGWYEYDFGKDLYLRKIGMFSKSDFVQILYKEKFVLDVDTTSSEGKYKAASKLYSAKNLTGWSHDDYQQLYDLGFKLLIESAEDGYTPAQILLWKQIIFNNDPNVENDKLALKYAEKVAEGTGEDAIDALLYLQKNYLLGPNSINNSYRDAQTMEGKARYVGPKDLKKSRLLLEKIMANESALKYFVRKGGGFGRRGAELELNDLNKAIGDRPYKDFAGEISKKILGTWKMAVYDGITSIYTFRSDGTFKATHTYTYPQLSSGATVKFDVTGKWHINKNNSVEISDYNRFQNIKASYTNNDFYVRRIVNKLNTPGDDRYAIISDIVRQCSGNLNYIGWMEHNTFSGLVFSNNQMKGSYNTWNIFKEVTLTKISTQAKKPVSKRR